jgi:FSR family fosmidomycin resistance protein-like MFS transporter
LPASVALTAIGVSAVAASTSLPWLVAFVVIGGFGSAVMHPEAGRYSSLLGGAKRASAISIFQIGGQVGYGIGPLVAAALIAHGGAASVFALAIPGVVAALVVAAVLPSFARDADERSPRHDAAAAGPRAPIDRTSVALLVASTGLRYLTGASFAFYLPNLLTARGLPLTATGAVVTAFLIAAAVGLYAGGACADRFGAARTAVAGLVASVPPLLLGLALHGPLAVALLLLGSALISVQNAPGVALAQSLLPRNLGTALGLMNGVAFGLGSLGVALVGVVVTRSGPDAALALTALAPLGAAVAYLIVARRRARALVAAALVCAVLAVGRGVPAAAQSVPPAPAPVAVSVPAASTALLVLDLTDDVCTPQPACVEMIPGSRRSWRTRAVRARSCCTAQRSRAGTSCRSPLHVSSRRWRRAPAKPS